MSTSILTSSPLFTQVPQISTYPNIACLIAAQTPIATTLNGQAILKQVIEKAQRDAAGKQNKQVKLDQIAQIYQFNLCKTFVPKLIFNRYISRQFQGSNNNSQSTITNSDYTPEVQFKIDFDSSVVSDMVALITMNIGLDTSILNENKTITIQGYSSRGVKNGVNIKWSDVLSLQFGYCEDFLYHYISSVDIGFCNTGGSNPIYHQKVPIEMAWIYHKIILPQEMGDVVRRMCREDVFTIAHDPFHTYGNYMYQMKESNDLNSFNEVQRNSATLGRKQSTAQGMNEIAMYYIKDTIKGVNISELYKSPNANPTNWTIGRNPSITGAKDDNGNSIRTFDIVSTLENQMFEGFNVEWKEGGEEMRVAQQTPIMFLASTEQIDFRRVQDYFQQVKNSLPQASYKTGETIYSVYLCPLVYIKISGGYITTNLGFTVFTLSNSDKINPKLSVSITKNVTSTIGAIKEINATISLDGTKPSTTYNNLNVDAEGSDEPVVQLSPGSWYGKNIAVNQFLGCGMIVAQRLFSNTVSDSIPEDKVYTLNNKNQLELIGTKDNQTLLEVNTTTVNFYEFMTDALEIDKENIVKLLKNIQQNLFGKFGVISPYINIGALNYILVESNPYDENDYSWDAMYNTYYKNNVDTSVYPNNSDMINDVFRYNMAMLSNKQNEEYCPSIRNPDYVSIHTFRKEHGIVDFYFPCNFLFINQGISSGFPHYACASQSIIIKFSFMNPKAFINTYLVVKSTAIDVLDTTQPARVFINRIDTHSLFTTNCTDMRMVLFYNRYVWVPELANIITNYNGYTWVIRNYERIMKEIGGQVSGQQILQQFNRSVFYTKIWLFIVNMDTYDVCQAQGGRQQGQPLYVNKYNLPIFDVTQFQEATNLNKANAVIGSDIDSWNKQYNSPYGMVPVDSFQLTTDSTIAMQDVLPYRLQQFSDFVMLNHDQRHQMIPNNNLVQFNIDPIYYQEGTPNSTYSPAYAPQFQLKYVPKLQTGYNRRYGCYIISECVNVSYCNNHVMLSKYQTDN